MTGVTGDSKIASLSSSMDGQEVALKGRESNRVVSLVNLTFMWLLPSLSIVLDLLWSHL